MVVGPAGKVDIRVNSQCARSPTDLFIQLHRDDIRYLLFAFLSLFFTQISEKENVVRNGKISEKRTSMSIFHVVF